MRQLRFPWVFLVPMAVLAAGPFLAAQDDEDEEEEFVEFPLGLVAVYQAPDGKELLRRMEPVPRLYGGDSIHPKVPAGGFRGLIDEVALWSRALDASEILALARGESHLALTEAALFTPQELSAQWAALGEDPAALVPALAELPKDLLVQSLWNYLTLGEKAPPPLEEAPELVLPDLLRVYVQRGPTFVGGRLFGRGVSCGFPMGTLLVDADRLEPAATWYDGFLIRVPTNYFGLNWRAPRAHELFARSRHSLVFQKPFGGAWHEPPLPLECDPNTESRFDGYTVGRHDITFRYRLAFDGRQLPVSDRLRVDRREAWRGFVRELVIDKLPERTRAAWTLPAGEKHQFFAGGEAVGHPEAWYTVQRVWKGP